MSLYNLSSSVWKPLAAGRKVFCARPGILAFRALSAAAAHPSAMAGSGKWCEARCSGLCAPSTVQGTPALCPRLHAQLRQP